jgi:large subunit ribosomal protein L1
MPNPKTGTVTFNIKEAINEIKAGKVEFRVDKNGVIHAPFGKISFEKDKLVQNAQSLIDAVARAKPSSAKGKYVRAVSVSSTMGPGIRIDINQLGVK